MEVSVVYRVVTPPSSGYSIITRNSSSESRPALSTGNRVIASQVYVPFLALLLLAFFHLHVPRTPSSMGDADLEEEEESTISLDRGHKRRK